jgi:hypothetical protein
MEIGTFIDRKNDFPWAMEPCLYIVRQMAGIPYGHGMFTENKVHRCGASGTHMLKGGDMPYGSENAQLTGLLGRMSMYKNYWLPYQGEIFAALRIKKQLVAEQGKDRVETDAYGTQYNVDRGNLALVRVREKEFHEELTRRDKRWNSALKNELFKGPTKDLIAALRTVRGEEMFLFEKDTVVSDTQYRGGTRTRSQIAVTETGTRSNPGRSTEFYRAPSITIRLNKASMDQLRASNKIHFDMLLDIIESYDEFCRDDDPPQQKQVVTASASDIERMRTDPQAAAAVATAVAATAVAKRRRSPRLQQPLRRSVRLQNLHP